MRKYVENLSLYSFLAIFSLTLSIQAGVDLYEQAPIYYSDSQAADPAAGLDHRLATGKQKFDTRSEKAFLQSVLDYFEVPAASQVLVFSKTSLQRDNITPERPRAIYFNEETYVGWVQGGDIELTTFDPTLGPIFYRLASPFNRMLDQPLERPEVFRARDCLNCHGSSRTDNLPGLLVRSVYTDAEGFPILSAGGFQTTPASPLSERWGGWYVTGENAGRRHLGNMIFKENDGDAEVAIDYGKNLRDLKDVVNLKNYPHHESDIVAFMVMEHNIAVQNALVQGSYAIRRMQHRDREMAELLELEEGRPSELTTRILKDQAERILRVMVSADETILEGWGIEGGEAYTEAFLTDARRDADGRSLKDLNLLSRLFKLRFSHMVYSKQFANLPESLRQEMLDQFLPALKGEALPGWARHWKEKERERIHAVLQANHKDLPVEWSTAFAGFVK